MMGGRIGVSSDPGAGSEFAFTIPLGKSGGEAPAGMAVVSPGRVKNVLAGHRLLLVEDNETNRQVARELLGQVGIETVEAVNGREAVEMAASAAFDGILMDLNMPEMDGLTAARKIRSVQSRADLPIIAMTASAMAGDREKCLDAGMDDHIAKPIKPMDLYETLIRRLKPGALRLVPLRMARECAGTSKRPPAVSRDESTFPSGRRCGRSAGVRGKSGGRAGSERGR